jgi:hypothetical protein
MRTAVDWWHTGRFRSESTVAICDSFEPNAGKPPLAQPIQAPPAPGISDGALKAVVYAREIEHHHATEQTDSTHARVSEALRPQLGNEEAIDDEATFRGVELPVDAPNGSTNATHQEPVPRETSMILALGVNHARKCRNECSSGLFQAVPPRADARVVEFRGEVE